MTWVTSVPILVFLGLSVLDLGPMYATDVRQHYRLGLMPAPRGRGIINQVKGSNNSILYDIVDSGGNDVLSQANQQIMGIVK